jgi:heptose I phosphotransferase
MMNLQGECFRQLDGRLTQRILLHEKQYFIKQHTGVGWKEIFKNLLQGRWPVLSAKDEWLAINKLQSIGIAVPTIAGYGVCGINPARIQSFILLEELAPIVSLEDLTTNWKKLPPSFVEKKALITQVAHIARVMHDAGINHRDFYLCHFLLKNAQLYLIDLHRAQIRSKTPTRWSIKDLAGLYFSSKEIGLTKRDIFRFMLEYNAISLKEIFQTKKTYWHKVKKRGERLYDDHKK